MKSQSLTTLAAEQLDLARQAASGRALQAVHSGREGRLRQVIVALTAGSELAEHDNPGEATLQVLSGTARLSTSTDAWEGDVGNYIVIPETRHTLTAVTDAVVLLTMSRQPGPK